MKTPFYWRGIKKGTRKFVYGTPRLDANLDKMNKDAFCEFETESGEICSVKAWSVGMYIGVNASLETCVFDGDILSREGWNLMFHVVWSEENLGWYFRLYENDDINGELVCEDKLTRKSVLNMKVVGNKWGIK